jgi:hypothetical protein
MANFMLNMLSSDGKVSSKRLVTFCAFLAILTGFFCNMFWKLTVDVAMLECMQWIVLGGMGFTASERFSRKADNTTTAV